MKLLIVEDQKYALMALERAVKKVMLSRCSGLSYDVARCYQQAEELISTCNYDLVLLDHRMPYEHPGNLEEEDPARFSESLHDIGYGLLGKIKEKNPATIVIGTSSQREIKGFLELDYQIDKAQAREDLERIAIEFFAK